MAQKGVFAMRWSFAIASKLTCLVCNLENYISHSGTHYEAISILSMYRIANVGKPTVRR
jgi:hypothetical protein